MFLQFVWFRKKNGRPSPEKDHLRNTVAQNALSHLKTQATVLKSIHVENPEVKSFRAPEDCDLSPFLNYSLNKRRRWEDESEIGVDLLDRSCKLNHGWKVMVAERVNLKSYVWPEYSYYSAPERFMDYFMIRKIHEIKEMGYKETELDSVLGQRYSNFMEENRQPKKTEATGTTSKPPLVVYNFLRAPVNYLPLLQKQFQNCKYGWDGPYWRRVDRLKDTYLELRYGVLESKEDWLKYFPEYDEDWDFNSAQHQEPIRQL